jgi:hypothetical protein
MGCGQGFLGFGMSFIKLLEGETCNIGRHDEVNGNTPGVAKDRIPAVNTSDV